MALWHLGYPDQALQKSVRGPRLAQELSHPFSLAFALVYLPTSISSAGRGSSPRAGRGCIALSTEQGFAHFWHGELILQGWALAEQGQGAGGDRTDTPGLAAYRATGAEMWRSHFLALLAEAHGKVGQAEEGLSVLAEALALVDKTGERFYEAELYRLKGELTLAKVVSQSVVSSQVTNPQPLTPSPQGGSRSVFSQSHRHCPQATSQIPRTARDDEPGATVATARQADTKLTRCYPRSTTGSPKGLIPRICKRPRRCWRSFRKNATCQSGRSLPIASTHAVLRSGRSYHNNSQKAFILRKDERFQVGFVRKR